MQILQPKTSLCFLDTHGYSYLPVNCCKDAEDAGLAEMFLAQYAKPDPWKFSKETRSVLMSVKVSMIS